MGDYVRFPTRPRNGAKISRRHVSKDNYQALSRAFSITDETVIFPGSEADDKDLASDTRKHLGDLAE